MSSLSKVVDKCCDHICVEHPLCLEMWILNFKQEIGLHVYFEDKFPEVLNSKKSELSGVPGRRLFIC